VSTNWYCVNYAVVFDLTVVEDTAYGGNMHQVPLKTLLQLLKKSICMTFSVPSFGQTFHQVPQFQDKSKEFNRQKVTLILMFGNNSCLTTI
jgi:hypothetical protein